MVRYCPNCGNEAAEDDKFCIKCGKSLAVGNENNKSSIDSKSFKYGAIKFLFSFLLLLFVGALVAIHPFFRVVPKDQLIALMVIWFVMGSITVYIELKL